MIGAVTAPIIFGKMHFLLISQNEFFHEIKCNGITSFMEFMSIVMQIAKKHTPLTLQSEYSLRLLGHLHVKCPKNYGNKFPQDHS